jgi:hypothetical protein
MLDCQVYVPLLPEIPLDQLADIEMARQILNLCEIGLIKCSLDCFLCLRALTLSDVKVGNHMPSKHNVRPEKLVLVLILTCFELFHKVI